MLRFDNIYHTQLFKKINLCVKVPFVGTQRRSYQRRSSICEEDNCFCMNQEISPYLSSTLYLRRCHPHNTNDLLGAGRECTYKICFNTQINLLG